jgi:hypothetical protein
MHVRKFEGVVPTHEFTGWQCDVPKMALFTVLEVV